MTKKKIDPMWPIIHKKLLDCFGKNLLTVELVADFTTASPITVKDWIERGQPATGERIIKLWHLMAASGLSSREFDRIPEYNRLVSELFGYSLISMPEVCSAFGHQKASTAFQALRGTPVLHPSFTLDDLHELYDESLKKAKAELNEKLAEVAKLEPKDAPASPREPRVRKEVRAVATQPATVSSAPLMPTLSVTDGVSAGVALASLLGAALPLARHLNGGKPEARSQFRELVGAQNLFDLSNLLNALCGERARSNLGGK